MTKVTNMMKLAFAAFLSIVMLPAMSQNDIAMQASTLGTDIVSKDIGDPSANPWVVGQWITVGGEVTILNECPDNPEAPKTGAKAMRVSVHYPKRTFGGWNASPKNKVLPGKPTKLSVWVRNSSDPACEPKLDGLGFDFVDANTNKFNVYFGAKLGEGWKYVEKELPKVVRGKDGKNVPVKYPIVLESMSQSNWGDRNNPNDVSIVIDYFDLRLYTDMSEVAPSKRPFNVQVSFPAIGNNFFYGIEKPEIVVAAGSWIGQEKTIEFDGKVVSSTGEERVLKIPNLKCFDSSSITAPLPFTEPGAYTVSLTAKGFPEVKTFTHRFIITRKPPKLTEEEKLWSIYAMNLHGGTFCGYEFWERIGMVWVRDYAYTFPWMVNARGEGGYKGWPWYPKILKSALDHDLMTLPCLMHSINGSQDKVTGKWKINPMTKKWRRDMSLIVATFPELRAWELDNEKDTLMFNDPENYDLYHKTFGEVVHGVDPDVWAVEQGAAGIYVEPTRERVLSGAFDDIDVCNGHRYCGIYAPELAKNNANTGQGEAKQEYARDQWRRWKRAACADGKQRQIWITEFGWDTRAGQIVTEWEQAAYCQRGYMQGYASGVDKIFWYWYFDSDTPDPRWFFDGCGLYDRFHEPKPVSAAFSAMRTFLPANVKFVGYANPTSNSRVQIFEVNGKFVAAAFKLDKDGPDTFIDDPKAEKYYDMYGSEVKQTKGRKLDIAPTWYIGYDKNHEWMKQTPVDILSDSYLLNVAGEVIEFKLDNMDKVDYTITCPADWKQEKVADGINVTTPQTLPRSSHTFTVVGKCKATGVEKVMTVELDVIPEVYAKSYSVQFDGKFYIECVNQSKYKQTHILKAQVPEGWVVEPAQTEYTAEPNEKVTINYVLKKSTSVRADDKENAPYIRIESTDGRLLDRAPIVQRDWTLNSKNNVKIDGNLKEWDANNQLPTWMVGPLGDNEKSKVYMAYSKDGLYLAFDVADSQCFCADPRSFWRATDCLEFMFNSSATFEIDEKWTKNHHQFWFCPLADENRAYAGIWGRAEGQESIYDIPEVKSVVKKTADGYIMEAFIPAQHLHGFKPVPGTMAGVSFTMAVQGHKRQREFYWPGSKADNLVVSPWAWGKVKFGK